LVSFGGKRPIGKLMHRWEDNIKIDQDKSRIYGPLQRKGCQPYLWNSEIYCLYKDLSIVDDIKIRTLGQKGHIIAMEEERIQKMVPGNFHSRRSVEKQRKR
jgi:hypothetical protein